MHSAGPIAAPSSGRRPKHQQRPANLRRPREPHGASRVGPKVAPRVEGGGREDHDADPSFVDVCGHRHPPCIALVRTGAEEGRARVGCRGQDVERKKPLREGGPLLTEARPARQQPLAPGVLDPEPGRRDRELPAWRQIGAVRDRKKRNAMEVHAAQVWIRVERDIEEKMSCFMCRQANRAAGNQPPNGCSPVRTRRGPGVRPRLSALSRRRRRDHCKLQNPRE